MFSKCCRIELSQIATFSCHLLIVLGGQLQKRYKLFHSACHVKHISLFHNSDQLKYVFIITMYRNKNIKKTYYLKDEKIEDRYRFSDFL